MMKNLFTALVLSSVLSSCRPSDFEKQKLAFEEQKYKDQQAAKAEVARKEEQDKQEQQRNWASCRDTATSEYNHELKYWGKPKPENPDVLTGDADILQGIKNRLQRKNEECDRNFPKGINY